MNIFVINQKDRDVAWLVCVCVPFLIDCLVDSFMKEVIAWEKHRTGAAEVFPSPSALLVHIPVHMW